MRQVVPEETFNPDPDARYHRSLLDAFPVRGQPLLLMRLDTPTQTQRLAAMLRRFLSQIWA